MYRNKAKNNIKCFILQMNKFRAGKLKNVPHSQEKEISKEFCSSLPYFYTYPI